MGDSVGGSVGDPSSPTSNSNRLSPPPPLSLFSISKPNVNIVNDSESIKKFIQEPFVRDIVNTQNVEIENFYEYPHIYVGKKQVLLKFSRDGVYKSNITNEWAIYKKIYALPDIERYKHYFLEGVIGGEYDSRGYIILPYMDGLTLEEYIKKNIHSIDDKILSITICKYLEEAAYALEYLLTHGICHGDMHAGNIFLTLDKTKANEAYMLKIIDFDKAGQCDQLMNLGYSSVTAGYKKNTVNAARQSVRRDVNFLGLAYDKNYTGFFVMCKDIFNKFTYLRAFIERINIIIEEYKQREDVFLAYKKIISLLKSIQAQEGGRRTRRTSVRLRLRLCRSRNSCRSRSRSSRGTRSRRIPSSK